MKQLRIIIVSPFSPRYSSIASLRWEGFCRYLSERHEVTLITSKFPERDHERSFSIGNARLVEIPIKFFMKNPYMSSKATVRETVENKNVAGSLLRWARAVLPRKIRPDLYFLFERLFPITPEGIAYQDITSYKREIEMSLSETKRNVLVTTYGPWFTLKLGHSFKLKYKNITWIADFRDPSFDNVAYKISKLPMFKAQTKRILRSADLITVVTRHMQQTYAELTGRRVMFLPNGYDGNLYFEENSTKVKKENSLSIAYTGSLHPKTQQISYFLVVLEKITTTSPQVKFNFNYAGFQADVVEAEFSKRRLEKLLNNHGLLKRDQALELQRQADLLLLIAYTGDDPEIGKSIRTGKVYEYLASGKPILAIAPRDWDMKEEIECDGVSKVFDKNQVDEMARYLIDLAKRSKIEINLQKRREVIEKYLYKNLALQFEQELENLLKERELDRP